MLWPKLELMLPSPRTPNPVGPSELTGTCDTNRACLRVSKGKFAFRKQIQHMSSHVHGCWNLLFPFLPSGRTWKFLVWESPAEDKRDISETQHTGEAEVFWSIPGKADGNLKEVVLYVLRCQNAGLMGRNAAGGKAASYRSSPERERLWRQDVIFN